MYCMRACLNHLFRCIEPRAILQTAAELDQWFFSEACSIAGFDSDRTTEKKAQFMSTRRHAGSGWAPSRTWRAAYVLRGSTACFLKELHRTG